MRRADHASRLRPRKRQQSAVAVGVGWYTAENWTRVKATAADAEKFEATFEEWTLMAEEALTEVTGAGISPVKMHIDAEELLEWCRMHDKPNDSATRAAFVADKVRLRATGT